LLLQLTFPRLAKVANLTLHAFDIGDFVVALLGHAGFLVGAQCRRLQLLVQIVDFVERFFVSFGPVIVFLLGGVFRVVNFYLSVLRFVIFFKRTLHIDRSNFACALCEGCNGRSQRQRREY
jgi:hypothetical protein